MAEKHCVFVILYDYRVVNNKQWWRDEARWCSTRKPCCCRETAQCCCKFRSLLVLLCMRSSFMSYYCVCV